MSFDPLARRYVLAVAACVAGSLTGCGDGVVRFQRDALLHATSGLTAEQSESIDVALAELFGTPDEPRLPAAIDGLLDADALRQAAGPVVSHTPGVTQGLYRRHCARCHGVTGDGRGPTARYQAPYPRDFRRGVFKWKSTYRDAPPTDDDLDAVLRHGVPGTAMPSFRLLSDDERATLRQYAKYLAIRGQAEQALVAFVADELPIGEPLGFDSEIRDEIVGEVIEPVARDWAAAPTRLVQFDAESDTASADAGRELYHGERAGCSKCHGREGQGGAVAGADYEVDYDVWNRARVVRDPSPQVATLLAYDLPVRVSRPREIVGATRHGAAQPLPYALHQGIAGTPMPAVGGVGPGEAGSLSDREVADLVAYTQTLLEDKFTTKEQRNEGE